MGFRVLLISVRGKKPSAIHQDLGVVPTQQFEEIAESPVVGAQLANGDYLLYINDRNLIAPNDALFTRLSKGAKLVACYVNETCMESFATFWADGRSEWAVHHNAQEELRHLETNGVPPPGYTAIRDQLLAQQQGCDDVDYVFDVPVEVAKEIGGFRYDQDIPGASAFQVLEQAG
jgi:hypothetical protein